MSFKTTYILFGLLLGLVAVFVLTQLFGRRAGTEEALLPDLVQEKVKNTEIDTIEIERTQPTASKLVFVKDPDTKNWKLTEPFTARVDNYQVGDIARQLIESKREKNVDLSPNLSQFGLDPPQGTVTLRKGDKAWTLNLGSESPGANPVVYVAPASHPKEVKGVQRSAISNVFKDISELRTKDLVAENGFDIQRVDLKDAKGRELALHKADDARWYFDKPAAWGEAEEEGPQTGFQPAGVKKINGAKDLAEAVANIRVGSDKDFIENDAGDLAKYGLEAGKPETLRVAAQRRSGSGFGTDRPLTSEALLIGKPVPKKEGDTTEKYYARLESDNHVVAVPKTAVEPLLTTLDNPSALRNHDLLPRLTQTNIDAIDVTSSKGTVQLRRVGDHQWKLIDGTQLRDADVNDVENFLRGLFQKRQIKEFPKGEDAALGLDKPTAVVSLWENGVQKEETKPPEKPEDKKPEETLPKLKTPEPTVKLAFGKEENDLVYARRDLGKDVVRVSLPNDLLGKVSVGKLNFLSKDLVKLPSDDKITKVVINRGSEVSELEKKDGKWKITKPDNLKDRAADAFKVGSLLADLRFLPVERFVSEKASDSDMARFGLTAPPIKVTLTATKADGKPEEKAFLFGVKDDKKENQYAKLGDSDLIFLVRPDVPDRLEKMKDWTDPTVFDFAADKVTKIKFTGWSKGTTTGMPQVVELARKPKEPWTAEQPKDYALDGPKLEQLLTTLSKLKMIRLEVANQGALAAHGLDTGKDGALQIEITVDGVDKPLTLTVGKLKEDDKGYYAMSSTLPRDVFLVPEGLFQDVLKDPRYFSVNKGN